MPGYRVFNQSKIHQKYLCIICRLILREPKQTFCGHRFCESCFLNEIKNKPIFTCYGENCKEQLSHKNVFQDLSFKKELLDLKVKCIHHQDKCCNWEGIIQDYDKHKMNCDFKIVKCEHALCDAKIITKSLKDHL